MKKLFVLLAFCLAFSSQAQVGPIPFDMQAGKFAYIGTVKLDSIPKKELQETAWEWCASRYKFARETSKKQRKNTDLIVTNAWHDIYLESSLGPWGVQMFYTLEIKVEEGQYKYKVTNIHYKTYAESYIDRASDTFTAEMLYGKEAYLSNGNLKEVNQLYLDATDAYVKQLLFELKVTMNHTALVAKR